MIGVVSDPIFMEHETGSYHPDSPMRIQYIHTLFYQDSPGILNVEPVRASVEDVMLNHDRDYVQKIEQGCSSKELVDLDMDTVCSEYSYNVALMAAGSVCRLVGMALDSEIDAGMAFVRPPGHHARKNAAMGFCLFNNVAIAARKALKEYGIRRILICDFDVHHGNGTQESFYGDKKVLYFSTHQYPFYPGTGSLTDTGSAEGLGYTVNCPMSEGKKDGDFIAVHQVILAPIIHAYEPELILVSAGFDAHAMDPVGGMHMSSQGFGALAGIIRDAAKDVCAPVVYALEGGYNLGGLKESIASVLDVVQGGQVPDIDAVSGPELDSMIKTHSRFWPLINP